MLRDSIRVRETRPRPLAHERDNGCGEGGAERRRLDRADVGILQSSARLSGKVVVSARLHRGQPLAEAGKRERVIAYGADVVLGLPHTPAFDGSTRVERVNDAPPENVPSDRRRSNEEVPRGPRRNLGLARCCLAEQKPESWPGWTKLRRRRHREVALKFVGQQEHAVSGRTTLEVGKVHGVKLVDERVRPVIEHVTDRHPIVDAEGQVQVGEEVALVNGERAHCGSGNDALILLREP